MDIKQLDVAADMQAVIKAINEKLAKVANEKDGKIVVKFDASDKEDIAAIEQKVKEAESYYDRPIESKEIYRMLAAIAEFQGDKKGAKEWSSRVNKMEAYDWEFKGRLQKFYGNNTEAIKLLGKALELKPDFKEAKDEYESSQKAIAKAQKDFPKFDGLAKATSTDPKVWYNRGVALASLGQLDGALESFEKALKIDDKYVDAWIKKGTTLESMGKYKEALPCFDEALKINPKSMNATRGKNYAQYNLGM